MNRSILTAATIVGASFMGSTLLTPLYALYRHEFGFSEITLTLVYAIYVVGNLTSLIFFGRLSDAVGRRRVALPALYVIAASVLLFFFARATVWLFAARALSGFGIGLATGTATAWLADLYGDDRNGASIAATLSNAVGVAIGPLAAGALAQYAPWPLHLSFVVYLALVAGVILATSAMKERLRPVAPLSFAPRIGVPQEIRAKFIAPAVAVFGIFGLIGYYAALIPTILAQSLHQSSPLLGGAIVAELFAAMAVTTIVGRNLESRSAMLSSLCLIVPSTALLVFAESSQLMAVLVLASACAGVAGGLGYRGSLQVINEIAPEDRRAEVVSAYFVVTFVGNAIPVIAVGFITAASSSMTASIAFASSLTAFAVAALIYEQVRSWTRNSTNACRSV